MGLFKKEKTLSPYESEKQRLSAMLPGLDPNSAEYQIIQSRLKDIEELISKEKNNKLIGKISKDVAVKGGITLGLGAAYLIADTLGFAPHRGFKDKTPSPNLWANDGRKEVPQK